MADVGDDLLDGDLDETAFGDLDGEEEDALLADDDYESYQNTRQSVFSQSTTRGNEHSELYHIVDHVQDVSEGDEILEDGEEDVLELAVVDELDESELDNGQTTSQTWSENSSRTVDSDNKRRESTVGVSSSTPNIGGGNAIGGESDEEETDGRGSRFKTERTNIISLKGVSSGKSLNDIPDSLDNVRTPIFPSGMRPRGGMQRGGRASIRGRLGPIQRGGMMMRGGFGPPRRPMMPLQHPPPPGHKIHINPHFRGGMHQGPAVWDNERLPPPPGCESFMSGSPNSHNNDVNWGGPMPQQMGRPQFPPQQPGPQNQFQNHHMYQQPTPPQGYEEQYRPVMDSQQLNQPSRIVQFSENSQLITVENQHFQRQTFDQSFTPPNNQYQPPNMPPNFNNNYPNQFNPPRPNFQPHQFPNSNHSANFMAYNQNDFIPPPNTPLRPSYDNQNSWNSPLPAASQQNQYYPPDQPPHPQPPHLQPPHHQPPHPQTPHHQAPHHQQSSFCAPQQPQFRAPQAVFRNQQPNFGPPQQKLFPGGMRGTGLKRQAPRQPLNTSAVPPKQLRFEHKQKTPPVNTRSNLQEIKTVDNLPDTTTTQEPEIEEDEETKQYRLKIAEQKALREKILREKEARRLAAIMEKQKQTENNNIAVVNPSVIVTQPQSQQKPQQSVRGRGRGRINSVNKAIPKTCNLSKSDNQKGPGTPVVQIQQMLGTMYKIVKVRTKEGAIVTRKTPLVMNPSGTPTPMRTVTSGGITQPQQPQRRIVLNNPVPVRTQPQRVVIDNRPPAIKVAAPASIPLSTLVTIDNLSLSTSQSQIQKLARQVGTLASFKHEPELKRATMKFEKPKEAEQFYLKFHRKMIDLSRIVVTVVPE